MLSSTPGNICIVIFCVNIEIIIQMIFTFSNMYSEKMKAMHTFDKKNVKRKKDRKRDNERKKTESVVLFCKIYNI